MKHFLLFFLLIPILAFSQVPQGVGYQGVATDALGIELVNQSISIRASILSTSATGTIEWQEIHNTSTDTFGLFNLTIGQGISTGNGAQTSFADITWGASTHFLKIEMDVNGGANYSHMGTNQMMSVPYALYAENANINYDSITTLLSNDSTFITSLSGVNGGGCDFKFPDGLEGDFISVDMLQGNYTVPTGKNLYILNAMTDVGYQWINLDGNRFIKYDAGYWQLNTATVMAGSGSVLSSQYQSSSPTSSTMFGYLVEKQVDFIAIDMLQGNYTVPAGKNLYILNAMTDVGYQWINLDGNRFIKYDAGYWQLNTATVMAGSGSVLSSQYQSSSPTSSTMFGYLVDENYFADCGGGGGSSSSIINSLNNHGFQNFISDSIFIVPYGVKTLYINLNSARGGNGQNTNVLQSNGGGAIQYNLYGCPGGNSLSVDLILNCNQGDSIAINFGSPGIQPQLQTVSNIYQSASSAGSDGGTLKLYINSLNILDISGGEGGAGITYNGMNFSCWNLPGNDGEIIYRSEYSSYPVFVISSKISALENVATIKY